MKNQTTKTTPIIALLLAAAIGGALSAPAQAQSLTREQVRAEVLAARAAGTLSSGGEGYQAHVFDIPSTLTRTEVRGQLLAARAAGTLVDGEAYPGPQDEADPMPRTREQVRAELAAARAAGTIVSGDAYPGPLAAGG
jgi:hypothetical protein